MDYHKTRELLVKRFDIPGAQLLKNAVRHFTLAERTVFFFFVGMFIFSGAVLLYKVNATFLVHVPMRGGSITEGVVGNPRFINPVLAISEADKNLVALVYSGLLRRTPQGDLVSDLATVDTSADGLTYTAHLNPQAVFHDGTTVTADDVVFTIQKVQDPGIRSPRFADWSGVDAEKVDDQTVTFTLKKPYAPFIDNLTLGILPKHIWKNVTSDEFLFSQFNSLPVGSGPYQVSSVERDSGGIPNYYDLASFKQALGGEPYISHIIFKFYPSENALVDAYTGGDVSNLAGVSADEAVELQKNGAHIVSDPLPRIFGVFFNQNQNKLFLDKDVRAALDLAAPKEDIIQAVLDGYGSPIDGPLPPSLFAWLPAHTAIDSATRLSEAQALLAKAGWTKNVDTGTLEKKTKHDTVSLSFSISTSDTPELKTTGDLLKKAWEQLGAHVDVQVFDQGDLNQNVIRPRHYDALLFGEVIGRDADLYPFWHSSERNDPGLNIALYANSKVDKLLEDARSTSDPDKRTKDYQAFNAAVTEDVPAVFLYAPSFVYALPSEIAAVNLGELLEIQDRFNGVSDWYIETDRVWQIFARHNQTLEDESNNQL